MLSRKMDKLLIEDLSFRGFTNSFSQEMINVLAKVRINIIENLPSNAPSTLEQDNVTIFSAFLNSGNLSGFKHRVLKV